MMAGVANVKEEYVVTVSNDHSHTSSNHANASENPSENEGIPSKRKIAEAVSTNPSQQDLDQLGEADEPETKKPKTKGQNKKRPRTVPKMEFKERLCRTISADNKECQYGSRCKFQHDVAEYLRNKKPDIGPECLHFNKKGKCQFGFECRYGGQHISSDGQNVVDEDKCRQYESECLTFEDKNYLSKETMIALRKKKYDFTNANRVLKRQGEFKEGCIWNGVTKECNGDITNTAAGVEKENVGGVSEVVEAATLSSEVNGAKSETINNCENVAPNAKTNELENSGLSDQIKSGEQLGDSTPDESQINNIETTQTTIKNKDSCTTPSGAITDEDVIPLRSPEKKTIDFSDKLYLAPLTTVGNLPFRRLCKRFGADVTCGEMAMTSCLLRGQQSEWALLRRHHTEDLFGVQLCGSYPDQMLRCTEMLNRECSIDFIDINMGCPIDLVFKRGEGSALMTRTNKLRSILSGMTEVSDVPITIKMRTGVYEGKSIAHKIIPLIRECGASLATLHGRSREQRYTRAADWSYIRECAELSRPMPFFGNGDVLSYDDAQRFRQTSGVDGLMIARGALIKPWIFTEIKEQRDWDISSSERFDILKDFTNYGLEHWGSDDKGVESTRRFLLEWLSFLYRYIPVGILERPPQRINERPPTYRGRDDLETLFASPRASDWVSITEKLLGPVPHNFQFVPKHRANSYA